MSYVLVDEDGEHLSEHDDLMDAVAARIDYGDTPVQVMQYTDPSGPARALQRRLGVSMWKHLGAEGMNIHSEAVMLQFSELGCEVRPYRPEAIGNPQRMAWEVIFPRPSLQPLEEEGGGDVT